MLLYLSTGGVVAVAGWVWGSEGAAGVVVGGGIVGVEGEDAIVAFVPARYLRWDLSLWQTRTRAIYSV